jgi:hypothetical protein
MMIRFLRLVTHLLDRGPTKPPKTRKAVSYKPYCFSSRLDDWVTYGLVSR